jgi:hypothetical protein
MAMTSRNTPNQEEGSLLIQIHCVKSVYLSFQWVKADA